MFLHLYIVYDTRSLTKFIVGAFTSGHGITNTILFITDGATMLRRFGCHCIELLFLLICVATAAAREIPVEDFFKRPEYSAMALSPDGKRLASIVPGNGRDNLAVIDMDKKTAKLLTSFSSTDVVAIHWTNNERLLLAVGDAHEAAGDARFRGWHAVNADGSQFRSVSDERPFVQERSIKKLVRGFQYLGPDPKSGDELIISAYERSFTSSDVYRYNSRTGEMKLLSYDNPGHVQRWIVDRDGVPRAAESYEKGLTTIWYRDDDKTAWKKLDEAEDSKLKFTPIAFDYDNKTLYVKSRTNADKDAIYTFDFVNGKPGERIARHPEVDLGTLVFSRSKRKLVGIRYDADKPGVAWVDEEIAKLQKVVDAALPDTVNALSVADENPKLALVRAYSDVNPAHFYLLDTEKLTLEEIAASRPWIKPEDMSPRKFVRYAARDGLEIPAYLTLPKGSNGKSLPLVVDIHGGPWVPKQHWGFDPEVQFLASRGYAVLQPDFRGTEGYGWKHFASSFKQWGLSMQDDITDGVEWLIKQGTVDKERVCLLGGSYGGYATLWGLAKTPDLYRCGVAFVAVSDIGLLFDITYSDTARSSYRWLEYGAKVRIGDPDKDKENFRAVSPLYNAERYRAPLFLAYGGVDQRVPLKHGTDLRDRLDKLGKKYQWVVYNDEGHGFNKDENRFDFYRRVEAFLQRHLN